MLPTTGKPCPTRLHRVGTALVAVLAVACLSVAFAAQIRADDSVPLRLSIYDEREETIDHCPLHFVLALDRRVEGNSIRIESKALRNIECDGVEVRDLWFSAKRKKGTAEWDAKVFTKVRLDEGRDKWVTVQARFLRANEPISRFASITIESDEGETTPCCLGDSVRIATAEFDGSISMEVTVEAEYR